MNHPYSQTADIARAYYNSKAADAFYATVWGGEHIHLGIYRNPGESIQDASRRTVEEMAAMLGTRQRGTTVLDIGSGYGGSARFLAETFGYRITCLNISERHNKRNNCLIRERGLDSLIQIVTGSFEDIPFPDGSFDIVWSQDALLHSGNRPKVLEEISRVLVQNGEFIFTDPMQSDDCPPEALQPVLARLHLPDLGCFAAYRETAARLGWEEIRIVDLSEHLVTHYTRVLGELEKRYDELLVTSGRGYLEHAVQGLKHWIDTGRKGHLKWGILHFGKA